ncbi:phenylalanine--tRNA ligase subunit alpha [Patescibacteria group bacterium]
MKDNIQFLDVTAPGIKPKRGHKHLITQTIDEVVGIFKSMGFGVADGPEIEDEFHNFDALNVPKDHPARDMQDTFWVKDPKGSNDEKYQKSDIVLRTHTSPVQIHYMEENKPPIRIIAPGKVFRNEATDATHEAQFYQVEGLMVDENVNLSNLKAVLQNFFERFFGDGVNIRFRPGFFPFVEPGLEVDMSCFKCKDKVNSSCSVCKGSGWIEVMGAGMVHPNVLKSVNIDPNKYQGFAFGGGIDRFIMLKYGIDDVRSLYNGDLRLVKQF